MLGGQDDQVARYAAELSKHFSYEAVMFSGGIAHPHALLTTTWQEPEAVHFYEEFQKADGEARNVLIETHAQNTGDNVTFCYDMLQFQKVAIPKTIQIITKPYMQRRARATFEAQWSGSATSHLFVSAPQTSFRDYPNEEQPFERRINIMVGDLRRIIEYPARGLQSEQVIPRQVMLAWARLVRRGYKLHLLS